MHGVQVHRQLAVVRIRTGFRPLKPHQGLMVIGINVVVMRVNIRVVVVAVVHITALVGVDTVVRVWS